MIQSVRPLPVDVYVGAGSNIDPEVHLPAACRRLTEVFGLLRLSPVYRTAPVGFKGDDFFNLVLTFRTRRDPSSVVDLLESLHIEAGRIRGGEVSMSRTLDLDLLLYGDEELTDAKIRVPRDDITRYAFVLKPLADLAPDLVHPTAGQPIHELWSEFAGRRAPMTLVDLSMIS